MYFSPKFITELVVFLTASTYKQLSTLHFSYRGVHSVSKYRKHRVSQHGFTVFCTGFILSFSFCRFFYE